jgi:hypothetical protein
MLPALEETVEKQRVLIKLLRLTIKDQRDRLSAHHSAAARPQNRDSQTG